MPDGSVEGELPELSLVRDAVARDWSYAQREEASRRFYEELVGRYDVTVEWPLIEDDAAQGGQE